MIQKAKPVELDELDLTLVKELEVDARQSTRDLAKKLGSSSTTVHRRIQRLLEARAITLVTMSDPVALGFPVRAIFGLKVPPGNQDAVMDYLVSRRNTQHVIQAIGHYDILLYAAFRKEQEMISFVDEELSRLPELTLAERVMILKTVKRSWMYLSDQPGGMGEAVQRDIDESELLLIKELELCPRESIKNLGRKLGLNRKVVSRKLQNLINDDIVRVCGVSRPSVFGFGIRALILVKVRPGQTIAAADTLATYRKVQHVLVTSGQFEILFMVILRDLDELMAFLKNDLGSIPGVLSHETLLMMRTRAFFGLLGPSKDGG